MGSHPALSSDGGVLAVQTQNTRPGQESQKGVARHASIELRILANEVVRIVGAYVKSQQGAEGLAALALSALLALDFLMPHAES